MTIRVVVNGVTFACDRAEEAIQLARLLKSRGIGKDSKVVNARPSTLYLNGAKTFFDVLKSSYPDFIESPDLTTRMEIDPKSLPPLILGIRRRARKLGVDLGSLLVKETIYKQGRPVSRYKLTQEGMDTIFAG